MGASAATAPNLSRLSARVRDRVSTAPDEVWTPRDFADLGARPAVDKALQRLAAAGVVSRVDRGLYAVPRINKLTGRQAAPDYRAILRAITRRDNVRMLVDGMTAANDLGFTTAVPARVEVLVDARIRPIQLGRQQIHFRQTAASRLFWAGRPAMRIVQALYWMQDLLDDAAQRGPLMDRLRRLLGDPQHGQALRDDLRDGWSMLPIWMHALLRDLIISSFASATG